MDVVSGWQGDGDMIRMVGGILYTWNDIPIIERLAHRKRSYWSRTCVTVSLEMNRRCLLLRATPMSWTED
jgi:hypothetical protein